MGDATQIRVSGQKVGIIGLEEALENAAAQYGSMPDDRIGKMLLEKLSKRNYIARSATASYEDAFIREYKKYIGEEVPEAEGHELQIKILGPGCPQCDRLEQEIMNLVSEDGIAAELEHVRDPPEIGEYGVMGTPALVIGGRVKCVGTVPPKARLRAWIQQAENINKPYERCRNMEIKVLGPGCPKCQQTEKVVKEAVAEAGVGANIEKVTDTLEIAGYGVFGTPAVVVDGNVKSVGKIPRKEDVLTWIR